MDFIYISSVRMSLFVVAGYEKEENWDSGQCVTLRSMKYEGWNFNFGNAAVTFDTAHLQSSYRVGQWNGKISKHDKNGHMNCLSIYWL